MGLKPVVDRDNCEGCEECVNNCPVRVFQMTDDKSDPYKAELCEECVRHASVFVRLVQ